MKHMKVSVAKASPATDQKAALTEIVSKPTPVAYPIKRASFQFP